VEIWKKMWVGVFFWTQCIIIIRVKDCWGRRGTYLGYEKVWLTEAIAVSDAVVYSVSQNPPPRGDLIFHKRLRIFNWFFTHLLYAPICARLQIFIQLSPILTKLYHIKRDYPVHICSKCPPSVETHAFRRLRKSLIALLIVVCGKSLNTFIMSTNMSDMTWRQQWRHLLSKQT